MRDIDEFSITQAVIEANRNGNARLVVIMESLVRHLHEFAREVRLTEEEWFQGIRFLTETGQMCDEKRQEFILLSDTLGLSTLVTALNNRKPQECTEATVFGPFYVEDSPTVDNGDDIANGAHGIPCFVSGSVHGLDGKPVAAAELAVWQCDDDGLYDVQRPDLDHFQGRARLLTDAEGRFNFRSILAVPYPIPHDGPVGRMLEGLGRHPWRPAHLHFKIEAAGYERLITHIFRDDGEYLDSDAVFGVRSTLISNWTLHPPGVAPDGTPMDQPYYTLHQDFVLCPNSAAEAKGITAR